MQFVLKCSKNNGMKKQNVAQEKFLSQTKLSLKYVNVEVDVGRALNISYTLPFHFLNVL